MNIDLLVSNQNVAGLISDESFKGSLAGVMFDAETGVMMLEFADADSIELNIPVELEIARVLADRVDIHLGILDRGAFAETRQLPLILQNDPFGGGNAGYFAVKPRQSVMDFENFMKRAISGQPVHRDDLGDEAAAESVMAGFNPAVLQFAPHLARQRTMEAAPKMQPSGPGPSMGMGGGGGGGGGSNPSYTPRTGTKRGDDGDEI